MKFTNEYVSNFLEFYTLVKILQEKLLEDLQGFKVHRLRQNTEGAIGLGFCYKFEGDDGEVTSVDIHHVLDDPKHPS